MFEIPKLFNSILTEEKFGLCLRDKNIDGRHMIQGEAH